jgi:hypothetical protein
MEEEILKVVKSIALEYKNHNVDSDDDVCCAICGGEEQTYFLQKSHHYHYELSHSETCATIRARKILKEKYNIITSLYEISYEINTYDFINKREIWKAISDIKLFFSEDDIKKEYFNNIESEKHKYKWRKNIVIEKLKEV